MYCQCNAMSSQRGTYCRQDLWAEISVLYVILLFLITKSANQWDSPVGLTFQVTFYHTSEKGILDIALMHCPELTLTQPDGCGFQRWKSAFWFQNDLNCVSVNFICRTLRVFMLFYHLDGPSALFWSHVRYQPVCGINGLDFVLYYRRV